MAIIITDSVAITMAMTTGTGFGVTAASALISPDETWAGTVGWVGFTADFMGVEEALPVEAAAAATVDLADTAVEEVTVAADTADDGL